MAAAVRATNPWQTGQHSARVEALMLLPRRVRVLLAAEWARSVLPIFESRRPGDERPRKAIEAAEAWAHNPGAAYAAAAADDDAYAANGAYAAAANGAYAAAAAANGAYAAAAADAYAADAYAADTADYAAYAAAYAAYAADARTAKWKWIQATYHHARGLDGLAFDPSWRTETTVSLARGVVADRAFDRMPYLADALQDAGCDHAGLMGHLQGDAGEMTAADWALWNLLGYGVD